jgi:hypothetical protein
MPRPHVVHVFGRGPVTSMTVAGELTAAPASKAVKQKEGPRPERREEGRQEREAHGYVGRDTPSPEGQPCGGERVERRHEALCVTGMAWAFPHPMMTRAPLGGSCICLELRGDRLARCYPVDPVGQVVLQNLRRLADLVVHEAIL